MAHSEVHDTATSPVAHERWNEKDSALERHDQGLNPVVESARFVYRHIDLVKINQDGVQTAARYIYACLVNEGYSPHTWREQPLHFQPPQQFSPSDPRTKACLDWIFLVSSLNFSFWSEQEGGGNESERFGVEWAGWGGYEPKKVWTGYWSLLAAINKALEAGIPITDPRFYASKTLCPDVVIENVFRPAIHCTEGIPLLVERIDVMREVGKVLILKFGGSYAGLLSYFISKYSGHGTALQLVQMVVEEFPSFRDEVPLEGEKVCFWKRAQIMVAETWAAFHPPPTSAESHPFFPYGIGQLTMFADYRVPQILHHLRILSYPPSLLSLLTSRAMLPPGSGPELSIRAASILAVEAIRDEIVRLRKARNSEIEKVHGNSTEAQEEFPSVVIDFFLWSLAKKVELGEEQIEGIETSGMIPAHRTRSMWY